jgi:hypothetical protein
VSWIRRRLSFWILVPDTRRFGWDDRATRPSSEGRSSTFLPRVEAVDAPVTEAGCPSGGMLSSRVHQRTRQRMRDVGFDGLVRVWWVKKRWRCGERVCPRVTFTESTEQVPPFRTDDDPPQRADRCGPRR